MNAPSPDGTLSWRELLGETEHRLSGSSSSEVRERAAADARVLVAHAAGCSLTELALELSRPATRREVAQLDRMVLRRGAGEPLQYVLGSWGFRTLDLLVDHRVLIPRPETEQVVEAALRELDRQQVRSEPRTVVDLGTGSGAIGLSIAVERVRTTVWLTDRSEAALEVARANLAGVGRPGARVRVAAGDWFEALPGELLGRVHLVVSNPPYVPDDAALPPTVADWEPASALRSGPDGTDDLRHLLEHTGPWLADGGALVCELSPEQAPVLAEVAGRWFHEAELAEDLAGRPRALVARRPRVTNG